MKSNDISNLKQTGVLTMKFSCFYTALLLLSVSAVICAQDIPQTYDPKATAESLGLEPYIAPEGRGGWHYLGQKSV
jgi:hypothetical protein